MASMNYVAHQLTEMGLTVDVDGDFILVEDPGLDFERSHDGVRGISRWLAETREEYKAVAAALFEQSVDEEYGIGAAETREAIEEEMATWTEEEQQAQADLELMEIALEEAANLDSGPEEEWCYENAVDTDESPEKASFEPQEEPMNEFAPAPPVKGHESPEAQMEMARQFHSPKETAQAAQVNDQDRGGIPNPEAYITEMKQELPGVVVLVKGQRFMAPEGWKIKERRPSGQALYYGSIYKGRKLNNQAVGSEFSLVRIS